MNLPLHLIALIPWRELLFCLSALVAVEAFTLSAFVGIATSNRYRR
jgi:hypothetical protein